MYRRGNISGAKEEEGNCVTIAKQRYMRSNEDFRGG